MNNIIKKLAAIHGDILNTLYLNRFYTFDDEYLNAINDYDEYVKNHGLSSQEVSMIRNYRELIYFATLNS